VSYSGNLPAPSRCESLLDIARWFDGSIAFGPKVPSTEYAVPPQASAEVQKHLGQFASAEGETTWVARIPQGRVFSAGIVISPDGLSIARDVSLDFGKPFEKHWLLGFDQFPPAVRLVGETAVIATTLGDGYCHWLLEELPRLLAIDRDRFETIIAHVDTAFAREAWRIAHFTGRVVAPSRRSHFICDQLTVPSLIGQAGFPTRPVIEALQAFALPLKEGAFHPGERLYVSREKARRRRITNEAELWARMASRGFVKIHLEDLAWSEQIQAFARARVIVSPHGAGLANLAFCETGTRVVECFSRGYVDGYFWRLASVNGLDYRPVVAAGPEPLGHDTRANRADFAVDVGQVITALD
jgi:hypothetical protein